MKVSIVHPERRTLQSIALEAPTLPKKLRPATRHELTLPRGEVLQFIAGIGGAKKHGATSLVIELQAEEGETLQPGCVCYSHVVQGEGENPPVFELPTAYDLSRSPGKCSVQLLLSDCHDLGIVIANPVEALPVLEGEANAAG